MKSFLMLIGLAVFVLGPNLLWLNRSTVRVENRSGKLIHDVVLFACSTPKSLGPLAAGASRFEILPKCGDDTLEIRAGLAPTDCHTYVEGDMYHVRAWFPSPTTANCTYGGSPPFTPLLLTEWLSCLPASVVQSMNPFCRGSLLPGTGDD